METSFARMLMDAIIANDSVLKAQREVYDNETVSNKRMSRMVGYGYEVMKDSGVDTFRVVVWSGNGRSLDSKLYALYYFSNNRLLDSNGNAVDYKA